MLKPGDYIITAILASASVAALILFRSGPGGTAEISGDGVFRGSFPLHTDCRIDVNGPLGVTHVAIEDSRVRILSSPCPNQLCVHMGSISRGNSTVVCVPNRVMVRIPPKGKECEIDAVTQ